MNARASEQQGWEHSKAQADPFFAEDMLSQLET
ncbi:MAG: hypothetical protein K0S20_390, partial [Patescibacteria group bacterium]|nr:hypothetical protein [Patescibacteria group bacterium]